MKTFNYTIWKYLFIFTGILSLSVLLASYYAEYKLDIPPCTLCSYQRYIYIMILIFSIMPLINNEVFKVSLYMMMVFSIVNLLIATYHTGIQEGVFDVPAICKIKINISMHSDEYYESLNEPIAACDDIPVRIAGLSMAAVNALTSFMLVFLLYIVSSKFPLKDGNTQDQA